MMYELALAARWALSPLTLAVAIGCIALVVGASWSRRVAWGFGLLAVAFLWVGSMPAVAHALAEAIEGQYPSVRIEDAPKAGAIVVLGGAIANKHPPLRPLPELVSSSTRVLHAARLYHAGKAPFIVIAAGAPGSDGSTPTEADDIALLLREWGVPAAALVLDRRSGNTRENAVESLKLVRERGVRSAIVVTSALHMPRAMSTFRRVWGNEVSIAASPVNHVLPSKPGFFSYLPEVGALLYVTSALKEFAGSAALSIML